MKTTALACAGLTLLLGACAPLSTMHPGAEEDAVRQAVLAWGAAYDSRDVARITGLYERDAVLWGTVSPTIRRSPEEILDYFKGAPGRPNARVLITDQTVRLADGMAFSAGSYTFTDGATARPSRFTMVFRRTPAGWRLLHHHSSSMPVAP